MDMMEDDHDDLVDGPRPCLGPLGVCGLLCVGLIGVIFLVASGLLGDGVGFAVHEVHEVWLAAGSVATGALALVKGTGASLATASSEAWHAVLGGPAISQVTSWSGGVAEDGREWLTAVPEHGDATCPDGLLIEGPAVTNLNALVFFLLLCWTFVGVAIGSDIFMEGIETITAKEVDTVVSLPGGRSRTLTVKVWNATIANLSLMALGSSAPEILLSVIEIAGADFYAGELGPSTIVGSAAFNLMVIAAVCVSAIPDGEGRYIKQLRVFALTATSAVLAYVWLIYILTISTPNIVTPTEGVMTLSFFPILLVVAYKADTATDADMALPSWLSACLTCLRNCCSCKSAKVNNSTGGASGPKHTLRPTHVIGLVGVQAASKHSAAYYRMNAVRRGTGGTTVEERVITHAKHKERAPLWAPTATSKAYKSLTVQHVNCEFELSSSHYAGRYTDKFVEVQVFRSGALTDTNYVHYSVTLGRCGGEVGGSKIAAKGRLIFEPTQQMATLQIAILPEDVQLAHADYRARQTAAHAGKTIKEAPPFFHVSLEGPSKGTSIVKVAKAEVKVLSDDSPGVLSLVSDDIRVIERGMYAILTVRRTEGTRGKISCSVKTKDGRAVAPADYTAVDSTLVFEDGVDERIVKVPIIDDHHFEGDENFKVVFADATGGATFHNDCNGGPQRAVANVVIECEDEDPNQNKCVTALVRCGFNFDAWEMVVDEWKHSFEDAIMYEGWVAKEATDSDEEEGHSPVGYVLALPWKLLFAFAPPPPLAGGWPCFFIALAMIGGLTAFIGDLAAHLGCCLGIEKSVTAITIVALGTSLPDTFASKTAAVSEPHADASLGNITGSNSVNVFLGLGLPWAVAAIYWSYFQTSEHEWRQKYQHEAWYSPSMPVGFAVPAGDLAFSVLVYSVCAVITLATLFLRRACLGYELGGPRSIAFATSLFFVGLWLTYIGASIWKASQ